MEAILVQPEVPATVAVIQTTTERDHNSEAGEEAYLALQDVLPWIEFKFYDEHSIDRCYRHMVEGRFSSVVFASNSLFNPLIVSATTLAADAIRQCSGLGMGIIILQQFLPEGRSRQCTFLPLRHQLSFRAVSPQTIQSLEISAKTIQVINGRPFGDILPHFVARAPTLWSVAEPQFAGEWSPIAVAVTDDGRHTVIQRSRSPRARIIVSALPLDWLAVSDLLANLVARSVMFNGTLYVHPEGERVPTAVPLRLAMGRSSNGGRHLTSHLIQSTAEIDANASPYRHFNHLLVHPHWGWSDLTDDVRLKLRRRLENDGSITACADESVTGVPMMVTVGGRPAYLELADRFALWLASSDDSISDKPTTPVRAFASLAAAIDGTAEHNDAVPRVLHLSHLRRQLRPYFEQRLRNGADNVDDHPLPTAAVASAMSLLQMSVEEVEPLKQWLERCQYRSSDASLRQAKMWLPSLMLPTLAPPATALDILYQKLIDLTDCQDGQPDLGPLVAVMQDRNCPVARRAILAEACTASEHPHAVSAVALAARVLHDDLDRAYRQPRPSLELLSLLTAALVRVHAHSGMSVDAPEVHVDENRAAVAVALNNELRVEWERERGELARTKQNHNEVLTSLQSESAVAIAAAQEEIAKAQQFGRAALSIIAVAVWITIVVAAAWVVQASPSSLGDKVAVGGLAAVIIGTSISVLGRLSAAAGCEPRIIAVIRFWSQS